MNNEHSRYKINFFFEYQSGFLWAADEITKKEFGYFINKDLLPLSKETKNYLSELEKEFDSSLNWDSPLSPSPWSKEYKIDFLKRVEYCYNLIINELNPNYKIILKEDLYEIENL